MRDPLLISTVLDANNSPEIRQLIARMGAASCRRRNIGNSRTSAWIGQKLRRAIGKSKSSCRWQRLGLKQPFSRIVANRGKPRQSNHNRVLEIPPRRDRPRRKHAISGDFSRSGRLALPAEIFRASSLQRQRSVGLGWQDSNWSVQLLLLRARFLD